MPNTRISTVPDDGITLVITEWDNNTYSLWATEHFIDQFETIIDKHEFNAEELKVIDAACMLLRQCLDGSL